MTLNTYRAAAYVRLSKDRYGNAPSIESQLEIVQRLGREHGVEIVEEVVDRDESASQYRKKGYERPGWSQVLKGLKAGKWNAVLVPAWDRGSREGILSVAELIQHLPKTGRFITGNHGEIDLRTSHGRTIAAVISEQAAAYSDAISEKTKIGLRRRALEGKTHAGGTEPYGHNRHGQANKEEAKNIRRMFLWLVKEGLSSSAVAKRLNEQGCTAKKGGPWSGSSVALIFRQPRLAGYNVVEGVRVKAWDPILTDDEHTTVLAVLAESSAQRKNNAGSGKDALLKGLLRCPLCKQNLAFYTQGVRGKVLPRYKCNKRYKGVAKHLQKGCEVSISQPFADAYVVAQVAAAHGTSLSPLQHSPDLDVQTLKETLLAEIGDLREREAAFTQEFLSGNSLSPAVWQEGRQSLLDRIDTADTQLSALEESAELDEHVGPGPGEDATKWFADKKRTTEEKRAALRSSLLSVDLHPANGRTMGDRLEPHWRFGRTTEIGASVDTEPTDEEVSEFLNTP